MILADKIIRLRKKNGWSQEELAEKLNVSRQAVSKWEGAQSIPDLDKILAMSELFGVTTDYLLKDEIEEEIFTDGADSPSGQVPVRRVSLSFANEYMDQRKTASVRIAIGTFLCIVSVIPMFILLAMSEYGLGITEEAASIAGLIVLLVMAAAAVSMFVMCGFKNAPYEFLEKEPFELEYGVSGAVRERQKNFRGTYARWNVIGCVMCVVSPVTIFVGAFSKNEVLVLFMLSFMLLIVGIAVVLFVLAGVRWAAMQRLLKEGNFAVKTKKDKVRGTVAAVYWLGVSAIFLAWSLTSDNWDVSWVIWPVAGVLFAAIMAILNLRNDGE